MSTGSLRQKHGQSGHMMQERSHSCSSQLERMSKYARQPARRDWADRLGSISRCLVFRFLSPKSTHLTFSKEFKGYQSASSILSRTPSILLWCPSLHQSQKQPLNPIHARPCLLQPPSGFRGCVVVFSVCSSKSANLLSPTPSPLFSPIDVHWRTKVSSPLKQLLLLKLFQRKVKRIKTTSCKMQRKSDCPFNGPQLLRNPIKNLERTGRETSSRDPTLGRCKASAGQKLTEQVSMSATKEILVTVDGDVMCFLWSQNG